MFKCHNSFCVLISAVCDNMYDCRQGEDELMCSELTCPGFLKCRGERRCVGINQLCDGHVDCFHSTDDVMSCFSNNSIAKIYNRDVLYIKSLKIVGIQNSLNQLNFQWLSFLNISCCELNTIFIRDFIVNPPILFVDFSKNKLNSTQFLQTTAFSHVFFVDLSFNLLHIVNYGKRLLLRNLKILLLMGNPLKEITVVPNNNKLALINLKFIHYNVELVVLIYPNMHLDLEVEVADLILCCILHKNIKYLSNESKMKCYGLLETLFPQICFYCVSFPSLLMSLWVFLRQLIRT